MGSNKFSALLHSVDQVCNRQKQQFKGAELDQLWVITFKNRVVSLRNQTVHALRKTIYAI